VEHVNSLRDRAFKVLGNFDQVRFRTDTDGFVQAKTLGANSLDYNSYAPTPWDILPLALTRREVSTDDVFLDIGCGKGRVLCQAATHYPFKSVVGIDFSELMTGLSRENLGRVKRHIVARKHLVHHIDARDFPIPDEATVVYLFNPFVGRTFTELAQRLRQSYHRRPRALRIIYHDPVLLSELEKNKFKTVSIFGRGHHKKTALLVPR
jgi:SAM-dependent methyltransferase